MGVRFFCIHCTEEALPEGDGSVLRCQNMKCRKTSPPTEFGSRLWDWKVLAALDRTIGTLASTKESLEDLRKKLPEDDPGARDLDVVIKEVMWALRTAEDRIDRGAKV